MTVLARLLLLEMVDKVMASWGCGIPWSGDQTTHRNSDGKYVQGHDCRTRRWSRVLRRERGGVAGAGVGENQGPPGVDADNVGAAAAVGGAGGDDDEVDDVAAGTPVGIPAAAADPPCSGGIGVHTAVGAVVVAAAAAAAADS